MAFTTEFIMGAGGGGYEMERHVLSGSGSGQGTVVPLGTVDAGGGAWIHVTGNLVQGASSTSNRPQISIGDTTFTNPGSALADGGIIGGWFLGEVEIALLSRSSIASSFDGTADLFRSTTPLPRCTASGSLSAGALPRADPQITIDTFTVAEDSFGTVEFSIDFASDTWVSVGVYVVINGVTMASSADTYPAGPRSATVTDVRLFEGDVIEFQYTSSASSGGSGSVHNGGQWSIT